MGSFGKVKSSAKVLAFIGEIAYIFFAKTDVNRPIPTLASNPNCNCSNGLRGRESATDTKTDTVFTTP
jgi:hypothetical protein